MIEMKVLPRKLNNLGQLTGLQLFQPSKRLCMVSQIWFRQILELSSATRLKGWLIDNLTMRHPDRSPLLILPGIKLTATQMVQIFRKPRARSLPNCSIKSMKMPKTLWQILPMKQISFLTSTPMATKNQINQTHLKNLHFTNFNNKTTGVGRKDNQFSLSTYISKSTKGAFLKVTFQAHLAFKMSSPIPIQGRK